VVCPIGVCSGLMIVSRRGACCAMAGAVNTPEELIVPPLALYVTAEL